MTTYLEDRPTHLLVIICALVKSVSLPIKPSDFIAFSNHRIQSQSLTPQWMVSSKSHTTKRSPFLLDLYRVQLRSPTFPSSFFHRLHTEPFTVRGIRRHHPSTRRARPPLLWRGRVLLPVSLLAALTNSFWTKICFCIHIQPLSIASHLDNGITSRVVCLLSDREGFWPSLSPSPLLHHRGPERIATFLPS